MRFLCRLGRHKFYAMFTRGGYIAWAVCLRCGKRVS